MYFFNALAGLVSRIGLPTFYVLSAMIPHAHASGKASTAQKLIDSQGACLNMGNIGTSVAVASIPVPCQSGKASAIQFSLLGEIQTNTRCLGIAGANPDPGYSHGGALVWVGCGGTSNLLWRLNKTRLQTRHLGAFRIESVMSAHCLSRNPISKDAGSYSMAICSDSPHQRFHWRSAKL